MNKIENSEHVFYLTTKQKEAVDENLKKLTRGNYDIRKYRYYYFLHVINVNGAFGKNDRTYISTTQLHKLFPDWTFIKQMRANLISWGIIKVVTNQFYDEELGICICSSYAITDEYKGICDYRINIGYYDKHCKFIQKIIASKHRNLCNSTQLEINIYKNLLKLSVLAPQNVINEDIMLHKISLKNFSVKTWSTGRIGYEFTGVKREHRKYLRLNGRQLIEVDIANCQILLATILFKRYFSDLDLPEDLKRLIEVCEDGTFYEIMMESLSIPYSGRENFKDKCFEIFFAPNYPNQTKFYKAFKKLYPEVENALYNIKKTRYQNFARDLQQIESKIIFNVYQQLIDQNISALTIHDSIVVSKPDDVDMVKTLLLEEFTLNYNLTPKLKVKFYGDDFSNDNAVEYREAS